MIRISRNLKKIIYNAPILVLIFSIIIRAVISLPLDNTSLPVRGDTASHLYRAWYVVEKGLTNWSYYWWGGHPFLRYFSPLSYWIAGFVGTVVGWLLSYKLIVDIFFVLTPLAFYLFLKEFNLSPMKIAVALVVFSLFPFYFFELFDGRYPTLISFFFCLLYWKFLKRAADAGKKSSIVMSSVFLALSVLTHYLIAVMIVPITFVWLIFYRWNYKLDSAKKLFSVLGIAALFTAFFWAPLIIETLFKSQTLNVKYLTQGTHSTSSQLNEIVNIPNNWIGKYSASPLAATVTFIFLMVIGVLSLFSIFKINKTSRDFIITLAFVVLLLLLISYKRTFIFVPVFLAVLASQVVSLNKKIGFAFISILALVVVSFSILTILSLRPWMSPIKEVPNLPRDGRVFYIPTEISGSLILAPIYGYENVAGWQISGEITPKKYEMFQYLENPLSISQANYYTYLKNSWTNYVVVYRTTENFTQVLNYFNSSGYFKIFNETDEVMVFETIPKSSYLEMNSAFIDGIVLSKENDRIAANFTCSEGILVIKENYHPNWEGYLNNEKLDLKPNEYDFMEANTKESGSCNLELSFVEPAYYIAFKIIPIVSLIFVLYFLLKPKKTSEEEKLNKT